MILVMIFGFVIIGFLTKLYNERLSNKIAKVASPPSSTAVFTIETHNEHTSQRISNAWDDTLTEEPSKGKTLPLLDS